jgi:hypothetical protein
MEVSKPNEPAAAAAAELCRHQNSAHTHTHIQQQNTVRSYVAAVLLMGLTRQTQLLVYCCCRSLQPLTVP